ncbi:MAG: VWA domain-containing protein [Pseudomonadota bacterium]
MNRPTIAKVAAIAVLSLVALAAQAHHNDELLDVLSTNTFDYDIRFSSDPAWNCGGTTDIPTGDDPRGDFFPINQVLNVANALDDIDGVGMFGAPLGYHPGYTDLGFRAPTFDGRDDEFYIWNCSPGGPHDDADCDNGNAENIRINLPAITWCAKPENDVRRVVGHELFHHIQYEYAENRMADYLPWGRTLWEGTARMMEDQVYPDLDAWQNSDFMGHARSALEDPNRNFWNLSYWAALGWKHMAESYAPTPMNTTNAGSDFILELWKEVSRREKPDVPGVVQTTIATFGSDDSLEDWFRDYVITNLVKDYDYTNYGKAYRYLDEEDSNGTVFAAVGTIESAGNVIPVHSTNNGVDAWSSRFAKITVPSQCLPNDVVGVAVRENELVDIAVVPVLADAEVMDVIVRGDEDATVSFLQQSGAARIEEIGIAFIGGNETDWVDWDVVCGSAGLAVHHPNNVQQELVGPNDAPRAMQVRLTVSGPEELGGALVRGLRAEEFTVYVGTNLWWEDEATILGGAYMGDEFWLTVLPPEKPDENTYDLHVNFGALASVVKVDAVSYQTRKLDQMLVIDTSGSMTNGDPSSKLEAAQNAASLMADITREDLDYMGLASFADDATLHVDLGQATDGQRDSLQQAISNLGTGGYTSVGDGLDIAWPQFGLNGSVEGEDWIVLLSDGVETAPSYWDDVRAQIEALGTRVNTIALGDDADQVLLQEIANSTDGVYYKVDDEDSTGSSAPARFGPMQQGQQLNPSRLANRLANTFLISAEKMLDHERFWQANPVVDGLYSAVYRVESEGVEETRFVFNWASADDELDVTVLRPDGSIVSDGQADAEILIRDTHVVVHVGAMEPGLWQMQVQSNGNPVELLAVLAGADRRSAQLDLEFGPKVDDPAAAFYGADYLRGLPMPLIVSLYDQHAFITQAELTASVRHPDGTVIELPLYDEGSNGDGDANDGVYANAYPRTTAYSLADGADLPGSGLDGSYQVTVEASGVDNLGVPFTRSVTRSFQVFEVPANPDFPPADTDGDGMPDRYEHLHACLDPMVADDGEDADGNGLRNGIEWEAGLNPCYLDSDRGGEVDTSELDRGANPFAREDDAIRQPIDVEVINYRYEHMPMPEGMLLPNANLLRYQVAEAYQEVIFLRSLNENGPFNEVAREPALNGLWHDLGLTNGQTYYYRVQPVGANGVLGMPSRVVSGTPNADPMPPIGSVLIEAGADVVTSANVTLRLTANSDVTQVRIGNQFDLSAEPWQPYSQVLPWVLAPEDGYAQVYVEYQDAAGNRSSSIYQASTRVVAVNEVAYVNGLVTLEDAGHQAGVMVQVAGHSSAAPAFTGNAGSFSLKLDPGTYDLDVSYPGYESLHLEEVTVVIGDETWLGEIELAAIPDADGDGVPDVHDNCTLVANPHQRDSNADGFGNYCDADLDDNGLVEAADGQILRDRYGSADPDADLNGDGVVGRKDWQLFQGMLGGVPGPAGEL